MPNKTNWKRFDALSDEEIRAGIEADPDAHPTDERFWTSATVVTPEPKETITLLLDAKVLRWFREQGQGFESRINAVLRAYVRAHTEDAGSAGRE